MATKFQIKRSSVSGRTPNTTNSGNSSYIAAGELALNLTDKKMYSSNGTNYFEIGAFKVELVNTTSNVSTFTQISTLQFDEDSGFDVTNPSTGVAKVAINSTFKYWQVDGVQKLTATGLDTVNFIGGNNIIITANGANTPQSIAFSTSLTPTFTSVTFGNSTVNTVANSSSLTVTKIVANGSVGTSGQVLTSNGTGIYWATGGGGSTFTISSQTFTGNGSNTVYTLSTSTTDDESFVFLNGVAQVPVTDYSISGTTLTFVTAPVLGEQIEVRSINIPSILGVEFTLDSFTGNGSNTVYTLSTSLSSDTTSFVYLNGVAQVPTTDYGVSGSTLTFTTAPPNLQQIRVVTINPTATYAAESFTANSTVNNNFTLPIPTTTFRVMVFINGVAQAPSVDYYVSGTTLVLTSNASVNDVVTTRSFYEEASSSGPNTAVQYNSSARLKGSSGFTFNETTNNVTIANTLTVPNFILNASNPPANSTSTGTSGTFAWDSGYLYIATGTNTWKKVPISTDGTVGAATAGSNTQIQFNDSGTLGASAGFTFDKATNNAVIANTLTVKTISANGTVGSNGQVLTSNGSVSYWANSTGGGSGVGIVRQSFVGNGSNTNFTLSAEPINEDHLMVYVDRVLQRDPDYSYSGTTLTFATAPDNLSDIDAYILTSANNVQAAGSINEIQYKGSGSTFAANNKFTFDPTTSTLAVGSNLTINTSTIFVGNSTVNSIITSTGSITANTITVRNNLTVSAITANGNVGTSGQVLTSNGTTAYWADSTGGGGSANTAGSNTEIQFNDSGVLGANSNFKFDKSTLILSVGANVSISTSTISIGNSTVNTTANSTTLAIASGVTANTSGVYPSSNTVATALGSSTQRWVLNANTGSFAGAVSGITTLDAGNTTITGFANVTTTLQVGTNTATFGTAAYVVSNGNVGIGTSSPTKKLEVSGSIKTTGGILPRTDSNANQTSPWAWNSDSYDQQSITALANALTINADAGSPVDGQRAMFRFKDNGTARALTWTTGTTNSFRAIGITLPTTTVVSKITYVGCIYNAADSRWDVVAVITEA